MEMLCTVFENHRKSLIASYVEMLSRQKLTKNAKNGPFLRGVENPKLAVEQFIPKRSILIGQKLVENAKIK